MVFLEVNGVTVTSTTQDAVDLMLKVAQKEVDIPDIAEFFEKRTTAVSGERPAPLDDGDS